MTIGLFLVNLMFMKWFLRKDRGLKNKTSKKEVPDGVWMKCKNCGEILYRKEVEKNLYVCPKCGYHFRIGSKQYIEILLDKDSFYEQDTEISPKDPLNFKGYKDKIKTSMKKTNLKDAIVCGEGKIEGITVEACFMDFGFMGGSMGSVVGEKVKRAMYRAINKSIPLVIINSSGGARMQEGILSLMQMAKTASVVNLLNEKRILYISVLTNPTTAGVMASYASLGDVVIAEPNSLLGFAGPRVIQQTIKQELPEGFQQSKFMLEHGLIDMVVERKDLKNTIKRLIEIFV